MKMIQKVPATAGTFILEISYIRKNIRKQRKKHFRFLESAYFMRVGDGIRTHGLRDHKPKHGSFSAYRLEPEMLIIPRDIGKSNLKA